MVEANSHITDELISVLKKKIENLTQVEGAKTAKKVEMFEELKIKIRPKMVVVQRELGEITKIIKDFSEKNSKEGKSVFTKTISFYLDEFKLDSSKVLSGLDDEIQELKREGEKMHQLNLDKIESLMERISLSEEKYNLMQDSYVEKEKEREKQLALKKAIASIRKTECCGRKDYALSFEWPTA
jgi:hypothetical protein